MEYKLGKRHERMDTVKVVRSIDGRTIKVHRPKRIFQKDRRCSEMESLKLVVSLSVIDQVWGMALGMGGYTDSVA